MDCICGRIRVRRSRPPHESTSIGASSYDKGMRFDPIEDPASMSGETRCCGLLSSVIPHHCRHTYIRTPLSTTITPNPRARVRWPVAARAYLTAHEDNQTISEAMTTVAR